MKNKLIINSEDGFAAIIISMIIMAIIGLLVLGFASNTISNQKIALDNILSTQAYYNAESGINDAYSIIVGYEKSGKNLANLPINLNNCSNNSYIVNGSNKLDNNNYYTCLIVNTEPYSLEFNPVAQLTGETFPLTGVGSNNPKFLDINWQSHGLSSPLDFSGCTSTKGQFSSTTTYDLKTCNAPVLQVDIIPMDSLKTNTLATSLIKKTISFFLQPLANHNGPSAPILPTNGEALAADCSPVAQVGFQYSCNNKITLPSASSGSYYVRIVPIYSNADISVTAGVPLYGAQALIDSTGYSSGVYRRLEERICISTVCNNSNSSSIGALVVNNQICKQFTARPGVINDRSTNNICPVP